MSDQKERYYRDPKIVREYERRRFGRGGGRYVAEKETAILRGLIAGLDLPPGSRVLDCPTGTGRFLPLLRELQLEPIAADISPEMLELAGRADGVQCIRASADALPLEAASVRLWLMSRFAFHFADLRPFFREAVRVLAPGGWLVFDSYHWTPRSWIPGAQRGLGGRVHCHKRPALEGWLAESGLRMVEEIPAFVVTPYLYGFAPEFVARRVEHLFDAIAPRWKTKSYFAAQKP